MYDAIFAYLEFLRGFISDFEDPAVTNFTMLTTVFNKINKVAQYGNFLKLDNFSMFLEFRDKIHFFFCHNDNIKIRIRLGFFFLVSVIRLS